MEWRRFKWQCAEKAKYRKINDRKESKEGKGEKIVREETT